MKKILTYVLGITFLLALFTGCEEEEDIFRRGVGIYVDASFYPLDPGPKGTVLLSDPSISSVDVEFDGDVLTSISLTDGEGTFSIPKADIGLAGDLGSSETVKFTTMLDGQPASKYITFEVEDPLTIDGPAEFTAKDTTIYIKYYLADDCTEPTSFNIYQAINSQDSVEVAGTFDMYEDSIPVPITLAMAQDTVWLDLSYENSNGSLIGTYQLLINPSGFENLATFVLDTTENLAFDLIEGRQVDVTAASDSADIEFDFAEFTGGFSIGFISNQNAVFVPATKDDYETADAYEIENTDFTAAITGDNDVAIDDVFIFRTNRSGGDYSYGIFKIKDVVKPQGILDDSYIEIEVKF